MTRVPPTINGQSCFSTSALGGLGSLPGGSAAASSSAPRSMAAGSSRDRVLNSTGLAEPQISSSSLVWVYRFVNSPDSSTSM